ncbi:MAG: 3,5-dihydroxyphenylacetyl-CoA synthase DpgA [Candidatus Competibacterales bacterium]
MNATPHSALRAKILAIGTANPPERYTQQEVLQRFGMENTAIGDIFRAAHIRTRHLLLPETDAEGRPHDDQESLLKKHRQGALSVGSKAIEGCLARAGLSVRDIGYLCCISSTGFMMPGLTAMFIRHLGFPTQTQRADIVGMGCNAGLNGLNPVAAWAQANPGRYALIVCCEINSAIYLHEETIATGVVNSLFGDGCAAAVVSTEQRDMAGAPEILGFQSHIVPDHWRAMHYRWRPQQSRFSFHLDREVPYVLGANIRVPVFALLERFALKTRNISHWVVHSGGKKVIDAVKYAIGLTAHDVRHTTGILRDYGNLGSGSFLFSYDRLLSEGRVAAGDYGVMMTMGPGSTIETALIRW